MKIISAVLLACLLFAGIAYGTPVGPVCGTCQGGVYDLTYSPVSIGAVNDVFNLFLVVDTTFYTGGGSYMGAVTPKPSDSILGFSLLSAPGGVGGWTTSLGGLNANGCDNAGAGFLCSGSSPGALLAGHPINSWEWQIAIPHGSLLTDPGEASIKVQFTDVNGNKVGALVSQDATLSPHGGEVSEPGTVFLMAGGLFFLALRTIRKKHLGSP